MKNKSGIYGTVTGKMYCELPEGHRTTFIVGMIDMLGVAHLYVAPEHKARFDATFRYLHGYENDSLRRRFDDYLSAHLHLVEFGIASTFFAAVNEWCGFDDPQPRSAASWIGRLFD